MKYLRFVHNHVIIAQVERDALLSEYEGLLAIVEHGIHPMNGSMMIGTKQNEVA